MLSQKWDISVNIVYLALLYFVTFVLSSFISNAAVAIILTPIGVMISSIISVDPRPFLVAICFGASCSFITPMGYQTNMMVYGPGQYRLKDFFQKRINAIQKISGSLLVLIAILLIINFF